jgi:hypothetical protein
LAIEITWAASIEPAAATGVGGADVMKMVAAMAAETSARAPGVVNRKMLLSTNASEWGGRRRGSHHATHAEANRAWAMRRQGPGGCRPIEKKMDECATGC